MSEDNKKATEIKTKELPVHIAKIVDEDGSKRYLFLRKIDKNGYSWYKESADGALNETSISAYSIEEALRIAASNWKDNSFNTVICGFRYTLPERDEHGINALFYQMAASYRSMNGIYFDEELKNNCFVQNASAEALTLLHRLSS